MGRTSHKVVIAAAMATLASLGLASTAGAHHSSPAAPTDPVTACGQIINQDTTLTHDVGPCPGDGITIGASGTPADPTTGTPANPITLDLNGHTITGTGAAGSRGIAVDGKTDVEIKGSGTVRSFGRGVSVSASTKVTVSSMTASANAGAGVFIGGGPSSTTYGSGNTVDNVTVDLNLGTILSDYGEGIQIDDSDGNTVKNSRVSLNGPYSGITLLGDSDYNKIGGGNTVENNIEPSGTSNQDDGIRLEPDYGTGTFPNNNSIEANTVKGNALDGISLLAGPGPSEVPCDNTITNNTVADNGKHTYAHRKGDGIRVFIRCNGNTITGNTVTGNGASGIRLDSRGNSVQGNTATGNCSVPDAQRPCEGSPLLVPPAESQGADLYDSLPDKKCGNVSPTPVNPNHWGNVTANTFGTRNRDCIN